MREAMSHAHEPSMFWEMISRNPTSPTIGQDVAEAQALPACR